jgi:hypothetical protein
MTSPADPFAGHPAARMISDRIFRHSGIRIDPFISRIHDSYYHQNCPDGFHCSCTDVGNLLGLLKGSPRFGLATMIFDMKPNAVVFREISQPDSLHLRLHRFDGVSEMHLDTVSIVEGRDSAGQVIYVEDLSRDIEHLGVDKLHRKK